MLRKVVTKVFLKTFGCRTNLYDSAIMISKLKDFEVIDSEKDADIVVVNSCTVTNSADSNIRSYITKQNKNKKRVILAGCGAFSKGEELLKQKKIFGVFGHSEKENINELLKNKSNFYKLGDLKSVDKTIVTEFKNKTKAFINFLIAKSSCN